MAHVYTSANAHKLDMLTHSIGGTVNSVEANPVLGYNPVYTITYGANTMTVIEEFEGVQLRQIITFDPASGKVTAVSASEVL